MKLGFELGSLALKSILPPINNDIVKNIKEKKFTKFLIMCFVCGKHGTNRSDLK